MRILLDYRPALRQRTGVGEYVHETARALAASRQPGESLVLFASSWKDRLPSNVMPPVETVDRRVPVRVLNYAWHRLRWPPVEWLAGGGIDVVQSMHPLLIPSSNAARLVTVHDLDFLDHPERTGAEVRRDYGALAASHAREADQVVVVSSHTARQVESRLGVPASHITICPPGAPDWSPREQQPGSDGCILFLGTLDARKNLESLLDAYTELLRVNPEAPSLVLAGSMTPAAEELVARTRIAPLAGRVELPGYVSAADKIALFTRALVFVLPSHTEGFGIPAVEAMKMGVPVIASNRGALAETLGAAGRLIDPGDRRGLVHALMDILGSEDLRRTMSEAGVRQAAQFTWARTASRMREAWQLARQHRDQRHG